MEVSQRCRPTGPTHGRFDLPRLSPWTFACAHPPDAWRLSLLCSFPFCVCGGVSSSSVRRAQLARARRHVVPKGFFVFCKRSRRLTDRLFFLLLIRKRKQGAYRLAHTRTRTSTG